MAIIRADLTVLPLAPLRSPSGWADRGHVRASFRTVTAVLGRPDFGLDAVEEATLWQLDTPGGRAQLQNWLGGDYFLRCPDTVVTWTIQAPTTGALPWIYKVVTGSTAEFPRSGRDLVAGADRETLTEAYLHYLERRSEAVYLGYGQDHADDLQRRALGVWRQLVDAQYCLLDALVPPATTAPSSKAADVGGELRRLAEHTPYTAGADRGLHDEFIATVRALAADGLPEAPATVRSRG
jgi:hypothetical protein